MNDYRDDRTFSRIRVIEYEKTLLLFSEDLSRIFDIPWNDHIHWFLQDIPPDPEQEVNGQTMVLCADDRTGQVLFQKNFEERHDAPLGDMDNNFYAIVMNYATVNLGYDFGPLIVDIQTPKDTLESFDGALIKIVWTEFEEHTDA